MDSQTFVVSDVQIFTGTQVIQKGFVKVQDGAIIEVGHGQFVNTEEQGLSVFSRPGDTLIPGLIDAHIHALSGNVHSIEQSLRFGVTTVCDMHNAPADNATLKEMSNSPEGKSKYADFKCAGLGAVIEGGWPIPVMKREFANTACGDHIVDEIVATWPKLKEPSDAEPFVKQQVQENSASFIKMFHELGDTVGMALPPPPLDVQKAVVEAAHMYGVVAVGHALSHAGAMELLRAGVDGLTHIFLDQAPSSDFLDLMVSSGAHCNPTLGLCASQTGEMHGVQEWFMEDPLAQRLLLQKTVGKPLGLAKSQRPKASVQNAYASTKSLYKAGVPLIVGTDAAGKGFGLPYGLGLHMEMHALVHEIGMRPVDVLASATSVTADRFGFQDRGKIEVGRKADLVLVGGDIFSIMSNKESRCLPLKTVWRDGIMASVFV